MSLNFFYSLLTKRPNKLLFVLGNFFQPSLTFVSKARVSASLRDMLLALLEIY